MPSVNKVRGIPYLGHPFSGGFPFHGGHFPVVGHTVGKIFYVDSGDANAANDSAHGRDPEYPLSSIEGAFNHTDISGNNGDVVLALPGHVETVTAAGGLDADVAGVAVIGIGQGASKPTINFTTAVGASVTVDAANITFANILFTGGIDALTAPLDVNSADFSLLNCEYRDVTGQCTDFLLTDNTADRLLVNGFTYRGATVAGTNAAIAIVGSDDCTICNFDIDGNFAVGGIDIRTTAVTDLQVYNGRFRTRNAVDIFLIDTITASTGMIGPNLYIRLLDNAANVTEAITGATFVVQDDVYVVNAANEKGMLINWTASTDAIV